MDEFIPIISWSLPPHAGKKKKREKRSFACMVRQGKGGVAHPMSDDGLGLGLRHDVHHDGGGLGPRVGFARSC